MQYFYTENIFLHETIFLFRLKTKYYKLKYSIGYQIYMDLQPISGENKKNIYDFLLTKPQKGGGWAWHTLTHTNRGKSTHRQTAAHL